MKCPNCDVELSHDNQTVSFEDIEGNCIDIKVTAEWCIECGYEHGVY